MGEPSTFELLFGILRTSDFSTTEGADQHQCAILVLAKFRGNLQVILVPVLLVEIFMALSTCWKGYDFFKGCNLLLQI